MAHYTVLVVEELEDFIDIGAAWNGYFGDMARIVLFLAADDSSAMTNQTYVCDGGWV
jgi:NAD(P)-dependent dehydrogenase (short-subunit alcohol dehydrogenase family)